MILATGQDLTHATKLGIKVVRPDGTAIMWNASVATQDENGNLLTPADGYLSYTTVEGDLDLSGTYYLQAYVEWDDISKLPGAVVAWDILPEPPAWSDVYAVRLEIGKSRILTDQDISYYLKRANGNVMLAASMAAGSLAGFYADRVSKSIGNRSIQNDQLFQHYNALASKLLEKYNADQSGAIGAPPITQIRDSIPSNFPPRQKLSDIDHER